jgi:tRNA threonylcarbamoyladenosine biosynthesis protein TsaE
MEEIITHTEIETAQFAAQLIERPDMPNLICLTGDLGSGKTVFTRGIANHFGIDRLTSPTFVIERQYKIENHYYQYLHHLDFYRLSDISDAKGFDISELISDPHNLVIIEWAHRLPDLLPLPYLDVGITIQSAESRKINIKLKS